MQPEDVADAVVVMVKAALSPVNARLAAAEVRLAGIPATDQAVTELRERVVVAETKADLAVSRPSPPVTPEPVVVDLEPLVSRIASVEAAVAAIPSPEETPDDAAGHFTVLLRKELAALEVISPVRMQKRVIRDAQGKVERVVDEPLA